ncbi:glycosyltransferase [uncultured Fibrobacter sp.]|uniref:glycosyltransferase family 2 protein n=1 Tax=uncultured Fibrobacter sp. TaxID=261512 RepID=UPI00260FBC52|nr:glycosyltransferase [uncultured Fibrobacter sp.]
MLVSIVIPVYKVENFLSNCIESVLRQTFKDFELILVDDGSPDNCGKICEDYAQNDSRIKVIHQSNGGLSAARNSGIDIAKGDYLTFIDSDDFVFPHYLETLVKMCRDNDADMSVCGLVRCSAKDSLSDVFEDVSKMDFKIFAENKMDFLFSTKQMYTTAWGKLYKRFIFDTLRYPVGKHHEDLFVTYKTIHLANKVVICDYPGYVYRMNEKSIVNESYTPQKWHTIEACLERGQFIELNYPEQKKYAYRAVVYYCNQILISMAKSQVCDKEALDRLQRLYRKYIWYYIFHKSAMLGKGFALVSFVNVKITYFLTKLFNG